LPGAPVTRILKYPCPNARSFEVLLTIHLAELLVGIAVGVLAGWIYIGCWKIRYTAGVREDAVQRSLAVTSGKVHEQLIPYLPGFAYNPKDVRFLGSPVDLVVFDGLAEGEVRRIIFLEVKTGRATLTTRERSVRDTVHGRRVEWVELRVKQPVATGVA
jgi:Endonuclease related to archaeal Holliday junction resolvase